MARLKTQDYPDYSGGLNNTSHKSELKEDEASVLHDWDITYRGSLKRRAGLTATGRLLPYEVVSVSESVDVSIS